jgi:hypothetical protein
MGDAVQPEAGLRPDETMRVFERAVELESGVTIWLRRYVVGEDGAAREWLSEGRWAASRGDTHRLYARRAGLRGFEWAYRAPEAFDTWEEALDAARHAEEQDGLTARRAVRATAAKRAS